MNGCFWARRLPLRTAYLGANRKRRLRPGRPRSVSVKATTPYQLSDGPRTTGKTPLHALLLKHSYDAPILCAAGGVVAVVHYTFFGISEGLGPHSVWRDAERGEIGAHRIGALHAKRLVGLRAAS